MQRCDQFLPQPGKKLLVFSAAPAALRIAIGRVGKDQVNVGGKIQLAATQFTHTQN